MKMTVKRETLIAPLGYMSTPNQYGAFPEGSLAQAENVVMRAKGKLLTAPGLGTTVTCGTNGFEFPVKAIALDAGHVYSFNVNGTVWEAYETNGTTSGAAPLPATFSTVDLFQYGRTSPVRARARMLVNSTQGVIVGDSMAPANSTDRTLRYAGLGQPGCTLKSFGFGTNMPIPANVMVAYRAIVTREFADGYIVKSVPSPAFKYLNTASDTRPSVEVSFTFLGLAAGDYIELYRTDGLSTTSGDSDPGDTFKLIVRYQLTSSDITAGAVTFVDNTALSTPFYSTTGKELYTNPYQEGETAANRQPDINGAQAVFKGFTFFGDLTERPIFEFNVPGGIRDSTLMTSATYPTARAAGVGSRSGSGTVTSGSNTVTGISTADMVGIVVGQFIDTSFTPFPSGTTITAVGATSFTASANATGAGTTWVVNDAFDCSILSPTPASFRSASDLVQTFARFSLEVTANQTTGVRGGENTTGLVLSIEPKQPYRTSFTIRATNGQNYSPPIPTITSTAQTISGINTPNLLRWSKDSEPEHVPSTNETRVGSGTILQLVSTKDALWIFCSDGIYRLSGDAGVWRIDVVAPGCVLCGPSSATSMRDSVYAYTNYGFVMVTDSGVVPISDLVVKTDLPGPPYSEGSSFPPYVINNDDDEEVLIFVPSSGVTNKIWIYNARQNAFSYIRNASLDGIVNTTCATYQQNPASGFSAVLLFRAPGGTGVPPIFGAWGQGNATWCAPNVQYRSVYAKNPMSTKQWIDMTFMFDWPGVTTNLIGTLGGGFAGSALLKNQANDAMATIGVPRFYALAQSLEPGFQISSKSTQLKFECVSVRFVELSTQQVLK